MTLATKVKIDVSITRSNNKIYLPYQRGVEIWLLSSKYRVLHSAQYPYVCQVEYINQVWTAGSVLNKSLAVSNVYMIPIRV